MMMDRVQSNNNNNQIKHCGHADHLIWNKSHFSGIRFHNHLNKTIKQQNNLTTKTSISIFTLVIKKYI